MDKSEDKHPAFKKRIMNSKLTSMYRSKISALEKVSMKISLLGLIELIKIRLMLTFEKEQRTKQFNAAMSIHDLTHFKSSLSF